MSEEEFISGLTELGLDPVQVQVAKNRVPDAHHLGTLFGEDTFEWGDERIEAYISESRRTIYDEYKRIAEEGGPLYPLPHT